MASSTAADPSDPASGAVDRWDAVRRSERAPAERTSAEPTSTERTSAEPTGTEQTGAVRKSTERSSVGEPNAQRQRAGRANAEPTNIEQPSTEQTSTEQTRERIRTEQTNAERTGGRGRSARSGRRPGNPDTRQVILDAARATFAEVGFAPASIRKIAIAAGVDAALVHHYFGSKEKLFLATVEIPVDLPAMIAGLAAQGTEGLGVRLATMMLGVWESPAGAGIGAALRTALSDPARAKALREFVVPQLIGPLLRPLNLPPQELEVRAGLVVSQVLGVITGRYLLGVEPLASLPVDVLAANVGATLQRYFDGSLQMPSSPEEQ